jgi:hypothetical protein
VITTHHISLWHQFNDESEVELKATVSLVGHPNELEVVWDALSQAVIDGMGSERAEDYEIRAEIAWADLMAKLDQPTDAELRADYELERWKEERHL